MQTEAVRVGAAQWHLAFSSPAATVRKLSTFCPARAPRRKLCAGVPSLECGSAPCARLSASASPGANRIAWGFCRLIFVGEEQAGPRFAHMPLDIVGEHAQQDVCARDIDAARQDGAAHALTLWTGPLTFRD
jgi:hypothetical protein